MIETLRVQDFALVDELTLEFPAGYSVLTGETGAGKSILLGALGLILGDRADSGNVKQSRDHADITAVFDTSNIKPASNWLREQELDEDNECIIRRRVSRDGRSRAYINGNPVNVQDSSVILNAALRLSSVDDRWEVAVIGKNLTDKFLILNAIDNPSSGSAPGGVTGTLRGDQRVTANRPRSIAVQATVRF